MVGREPEERSLEQSLANLALMSDYKKVLETGQRLLETMPLPPKGQ
jgi:hypothetical protein